MSILSLHFEPKIGSKEPENRQNLKFERGLLNDSPGKVILRIVVNRKETLSIHPDLLAAQKDAYEPSGLFCKKITKEAESEEYGAFEFEINNQQVKFRVAKITPTKVGQFVTLWKRDGTIFPYDIADPVDLFVVSVRDGKHFGQFVFPKNVLCEKGIVSKNGKGGKRGIRVYPPWDITTSSQAKKTQAWQTLYFFEIHPHLDKAIIRKLFFPQPLYSNHF